MHQVTILLTRADSRQEAITKVHEYLAPKANRHYDWYVIGGRWSGLFTLYSLGVDDKEVYDFFDKYSTLLREAEEPSQYAINPSASDYRVARAMLKQIFKETFPKFDMKYEIPYYSRSSYKDDGYEDDAMPLKDCMEAIQKWVEKANKQDSFRGQVDYSNSDRVPFDMGLLVYNITSHKICFPRDIDKYYAVVVDSHF